MDQVVLRLKVAGGGFKRILARYIAELIVRFYVVYKVINNKAKDRIKASKSYFTIVMGFLANILIMSVVYLIVVAKYILKAVFLAIPIINFHLKEILVALYNMVKDNIKKIQRSIVLGVLGTVVCFAIIIIASTFLGVFTDYSFSKENWINNQSQRIKMISSLQKEYNIEEMNRDQIEQLLGKPNFVTSKDECEYIALRNQKFDELVEYQLNNGSKSITNIFQKNYVIAYKDGKVVWNDVMITDSNNKKNTIPVDDVMLDLTLKE